VARSISWRNLRGVKTYHTLEPKMLIGTVRKALRTRPVPYSQFKLDNYSVRFDRDYAVQKIRRDLTTPLAGCDLQDILELVVEAYAIDRPDVKLCGLEFETCE
jgi:hypothetical protein